MPRGSIATPQLRAASLAGAATGMRSTVAVAALISSRASGLPAWAARRPAADVAPAAVAGELVMDKLPSTPSRMEPPGLAGRATFAALAGAVIARGADQPQPFQVLVASAASLASATVCHALRVALEERLPSCAVAAGEDGLALALAGAAGGYLP